MGKALRPKGFREKSGREELLPERRSAGAPDAE
jgi:hypothetical protein